MPKTNNESAITEKIFLGAFFIRSSLIFVSFAPSELGQDFASHPGLTPGALFFSPLRGFGRHELDGQDLF
jgi:hypothetical protein